MIAPRNTVEISIGTGYSQGVGSVGNGVRDLDDLSGPGGALELEVGYRIHPMLTLGVYGSASAYDVGDALDDSTDVLGASAGLVGAVHLRPDRSVDPWISLGAGWKGLWLDPAQGDTTSLQGLELARLRVGVDYRITPEVSISPVVGGSLDMFVSQDSPMTDAYTEIKDKKVNFTGFAGLSARFNVGG